MLATERVWLAGGNDENAGGTGGVVMQIADEIHELILVRRYRTPVNERGYSQPGSGARATGYFFQDATPERHCAATGGRVSAGNGERR